MAFYDKSSQTLGYVVYSRYGLMSHIIMNNNGVVFECNPKRKNSDNSAAMVYATLDEATAAKDEFYDTLSPFVFIAKAEKTF